MGGERTVRRRARLLSSLVGLGTLSVFAALLFGGAPAGAHVDHTGLGETLHRGCTWTVDKAADHTGLTQFLGQEPFRVLYGITVTATCEDQHHDLNGDHHAIDGRLDGDHNTPDHIVDECVRILDDGATSPPFGDGVVCLSDLDKNGVGIFRYERIFRFEECGDFSFTNTVLLANNSVILAQDSVTVNFHVLCDRGCTLTLGYWKTHSKEGPAPYDAEGWGNLGDFDGDTVAEEEDETFFFSGKTWYQLFWTDASGGNAYVILAHQYMAAILNMANGASSTAAVDAAIAGATAFFSNPANTPTTKLSKATRNVLIGWAKTLDQYNRGIIGPGHCDEAHGHVV